MLFFAGILYLQFGGIYHSFKRHGLADGVATVCIPPWAWYRAVETFWHEAEWEEEYELNSKSIAIIIDAFAQQELDPSEKIKLEGAILTIKEWVEILPPGERDKLKKDCFTYIKISQETHYSIYKEIFAGNKDIQSIIKKSISAMQLEIATIGNKELRNHLDRKSDLSMQADIVELWETGILNKYYSMEKGQMKLFKAAITASMEIHKNDLARLMEKLFEGDLGNKKPQEQGLTHWDSTRKE